MINFHKFGFFDVKKMERFINNKNYWQAFFCPNYIFIWSGFYKTEIAYDNSFCYIRFLMPNVGICYYPPLGEGDLTLAVKKIKDDAKENGYDFNFGPVDERDISIYKDLDIEVFSYEDYANFIHATDDLAYYKGKTYKSQRNLCNRFEQDNKDAFYRKVKKEDFPAILEFIENWRQEEKIDNRMGMFFIQLNVIKKCIEHLYELDFLAIILSNGSKIVGLAIGTPKNNVVYEHVEIALTSVKGAYQELLLCFAKEALRFGKYINRESDFGDLALRKSKLALKPIKLESFNANFRL